MPTDRHHIYFAEAFALKGSLSLPFVQEFNAPTSVKLNEEGGYVSQHADNFRLGGVVSFRSAYTQVAGNRDTIKTNHGWNTLTTAVIEGLNVMEVLTVDRVVLQISTDHPLDGYIPTVTFLGTRFENLRILQKEVTVNFDERILDFATGVEIPYTQTPLLDSAQKQEAVVRGIQNLPAEISKRYNQLPSKSAKVGSIECSLVANCSYPGSFGHIFHVPHFGWVSLGNLSVSQSDPSPQTGIPMKTLIVLNMLQIQMGCIGGGSLLGGGGKTNGGTEP